jgi:acyl carrier protein
MSLIVAIEEEFGISFEMDDILEFSSYSKGMEILHKYSIEL